MIRITSSLFALFFTLPIAHANFLLVANQSKWVNVSETDAVLQVPVCRAYTQVSSSKETVEFSMAYPQEGKLVPMIGLKTKLAPPLIAIKLSATESEYLFLLKAGQTNEETNLYWYAPVNYSRMEAVVRQRNFLDLILDPKGATPVAVQVSLAGSSNAIDLVEKCLKTTPIPTDFFKLLNAEKDNLIPDLGDRSPSFLFRTIQQAYDAFLAGRKVNTEILALRNTVAPLLAKETSALAELKTASTNFTGAQAKLNTAIALEGSLKVKLSDAKALLASLQIQKPVAEADLAKKKAAHLPLKEKMVPYEKAIVDAGNVEKSTREEINKNEALITKNTKRIPQLEAEYDELRRNIPGLERTVSSRRRDFDTADSDYRRFDERRETERYLDRDSSYSSAKRDLESAKRSLANAKDRYWPTHTKMFATKKALENCQRQPQPGNPNCANEQSAYQTAEREWQQAYRDQSNAESKVRDYERKIASVEYEAKGKIQRMSDELRSKRDNAESYYTRARSDLSNTENRIAEIRNALPVLRKQIEAAESALPGLRAKLIDAQNSLAVKTADRDRFSLEIGFEITKTDYLNADKLLNEIVSGIAAKSKEIPELTKQLTETQKNIPAFTKTFEVAKQNLSLAEAKLAPIQDQLKVFRTEESVKLAILEMEMVKFKSSRDAYQDLVKELYAR